MGTEVIQYSTYERSTALIKDRFRKIKTLVEAIFLGVEHTPVTQLQIRALSSYLIDMHKKLSEFETNFRRILEHASDEEYNETALFTDQNEVNDLFVDVVSHIEATLPPDELHTLSAVSNDSWQNLPAPPQHVRLPLHDLELFNGDVSQLISNSTELLQNVPETDLETPVCLEDSIQLHFSILDLNSLSDQAIATQHPFHIPQNISADLPRTPLSPEVFRLTQPYLLADPTFHLPGCVDVLLGGALFPLLFTNRSHPLGDNMPHMVGTKLGFVVMGSAPCHTIAPPVSHLTSLLSVYEHDQHSSLQRFWTHKEPSVASQKFTEELLCTQRFAQTHSRTEDGRYVVKLPLRLGNPKPLTSPERGPSTHSRLSPQQLLSPAQQQRWSPQQLSSPTQQQRLPPQPLSPRPGDSSLHSCRPYFSPEQPFSLTSPNSRRLTSLGLRPKWPSGLLKTQNSTFSRPAVKVFPLSLN